MTGTKTIVILTIPRMRKTSYKELMESNINVDDEGREFTIFDINRDNYSTDRDIIEAIINIVYITRKNRIDSIIMVNGTFHIVDILTHSHIPYYAMVPSVDDVRAYENILNLKQNIRIIDKYTKYHVKVRSNTFVLHNMDKIFHDHKYFLEWEEYDKLEKI